MKLKTIIQLDCREEGNTEKLYKAIRTLPFFKKYEEGEEISSDLLEKAIRKVQKRYPIFIGYIMPNVRNKPNYYSMMIKHKETHAHIETIYATTLNEGLSKCLIFMYVYSKKKAEE